MGVLNIDAMISNNSFNHFKLMLNIIGMILLSVALVFSLKKEKKNINY